MHNILAVLRNDAINPLGQSPGLIIREINLHAAWELGESPRTQIIFPDSKLENGAASQGPNPPHTHTPLLSLFLFPSPLPPKAIEFQFIT